MLLMKICLKLGLECLILVRILLADTRSIAIVCVLLQVCSRTIPTHFIILSCSHVLVCRSISHVIQFIACINHYVSPYLRNDHRGRRYEFICPSHRYRSITIHACLFLSAVSTHEFTQASHQFRSFPFPIPSSIISPIPPHHFQLTAAPISSIPNSDSGSSRYDLYLTLPPKVNACSSPYHKCLFFST